MKVLLSEPHPYHFEVIPGVAYYFHEMGYEIDLLVRNNYNHEDVFGRVPFKDEIHVWTYEDFGEFEAILISDKASEYDFVFFISLEYIAENKTGRVLDEIRGEISSKYGVLGIYHNLKLVNDHDIRYLDEGRIFALTECRYKDYRLKLLSASYFGDFDEFEFGRKKSVVIVGGSNNRQLLEWELKRCSSCELKEVNIAYIGKFNQKEFLSRLYNSVIGKKISQSRRMRLDSLKGWFRYKRYGVLSFQDMFDVISRSDFLAFIRQEDRDSPFLYGKTTGSKQLAIAFCKPFVSRKELTRAFGFPDEACVSYESGFADAIADIIAMNERDYADMKNRMKSFRDEIMKESLNNLSETIKSITEKYKNE